MTRKRETPDRMIERCCKYILLLWTMSFCAHEVWAGPQSIRQLPNLTIHSVPFSSLRMSDTRLPGSDAGSSGSFW